MLCDYGSKGLILFCVCLCLGAFLCVLGFLSAITVSILDKVGMKQLGLDGAIQEESRKVVSGRPLLNGLIPI